MGDRYKKQWENLGSYDPYWAVLSDPNKKGRKWEKDEFFESGRHEIEQVMKNISKMRMRPQFDTALDFGCGVGRLSRALSRYFKRVVAVDISTAMLEEAKAQHRGFANIEFLHNARNDLGSIPSNSIDFVYSNIVLQHMPENRQLLFISEFCRVLKGGGIAIFQTPSLHNLSTLTGWIRFLLGNRLLNIARKVKHGKHGIMEIHTLNRNKILAALDAFGMSAAQIERYDSAGKTFIGYRYYAVKCYRDREEPHSSPLPHHAAYGSVRRGSADPRKRDCFANRQVQLQGNESPSDVKCLSGKAILTHFTLLIRRRLRLWRDTSARGLFERSPS
jgi:ubiquinone/menaquinone biosynthesis C-methylase UbiE